MFFIGQTNELSVSEVPKEVAYGWSTFTRAQGPEFEFPTLCIKAGHDCGHLQWSWTGQVSQEAKVQVHWKILCLKWGEVIEGDITHQPSACTHTCRGECAYTHTHTHVHTTYKKQWISKLTLFFNFQTIVVIIIYLTPFEDLKLNSSFSKFETLVFI